MKLSLGIVDIPYNTKEGSTTGEVAGILEGKYHIMEVFYEEHKADIGKALEEGLTGALENMLLGSPTNSDPFASGTQKIDKGFRRFLDADEMAGLGYPGIPTKAAQDGVNHRKKSPTSKNNEARQSFIDTGLYQASFKSWVE